MGSYYANIESLARAFVFLTPPLALRSVSSLPRKRFLRPEQIYRET